MIARSVRARSAAIHHRLDAGFFVSPATQVAERLDLLKAAGVTMTRLGDCATIEPQTRFRRAYSAPEEESVPYLRPYDVFEYLPQAADWLSVKRTKNIESLRVEQGVILQTCSGRNLGPSAVVDSYLEGFAVSDDMMRIVIEDESQRCYVFAFLSTLTGQARLRRHRTGSVVSHLAPADVEEVEIPQAPKKLTDAVVEDMREAIALKENARVTLRDLMRDLVSALPPLPKSGPRSHGWTVARIDVDSRLDAAFHDPLAREARQQLLDLGGVKCHTVAELFIPGRYTRYYVREGYGRPILSGRQLLQARPINLQYISERSFKRPDLYRLNSDWIAFQAEGRAEERIGFPIMVTPDRDGWFGNNHFMRAVPKEEVDPGWLFLALSAPHVQLQMKALACGSVVDSVYPVDAGTVLLPPLTVGDGPSTREAWRLFSDSQRRYDAAVAAFEEWIAEVAGETQLRA